jgi:hypothetical protein
MVELFEVADSLERGPAEGAFAVEGVEDDALKEIAERKVVVFGEAFEDFQQALFHPDACLDPFDLQLLVCSHHGYWYVCTTVHTRRQAAVSTATPNHGLEARPIERFVVHWGCRAGCKSSIGRPLSPEWDW